MELHPETNSKLRAVIQNAKAANMPKDNIERALKEPLINQQEILKKLFLRVMVLMELQLIVETASDNNNRTVANIRSYFNKYGGNLGTAGSVEFMFDRFVVLKLIQETDLEELELIFN